MNVLKIKIFLSLFSFQFISPNQQEKKPRKNCLEKDVFFNKKEEYLANGKEHQQQTGLD